MAFPHTSIGPASARPLPTDRPHRDQALAPAWRRATGVPGLLAAALLCAPTLAVSGAGTEGGVLQRFLDRPALIAHAGDMPLTSEEFARTFVLPGALAECFQAVSSQSDDPCFAPGAAQAGFAVRTRMGNVHHNGSDVDLVLLGPGFLGLPVHAIGNNVLAGPPGNPTVIDFDPPVTLVGLDLFEPIESGTVAIRAIGPGEQDLGGFEVDMVGISGFAGFASPVPVVRIEFDTVVAESGGELFSGLVFGGGPGQLAGPDRVDFGSQALGGESVIDIELRNDGWLDLHLPGLAGLAQLPAHFTVIADGCTGATVSPGGVCVLRMAFAPGHDGVVAHELALAPVADAAIRLRGEGRTPRLATAPGHLDFGQVAAGASSAPQTLILSNLTGAVVGSQLPALPAAIERVGGNCPSAAIALAPGEQCSLELVFAPPTAGPFDAELVLQAGAYTVGRTTVSGLGGGAP